jgi:uncharacterized protein (TIGR03083 family)
VNPSLAHPMNTGIEPLKPILTAQLFSKLDGLLLDLLRSLAPADWEKQTVSPEWKVKDVAAHLLDTALRGVSIGRDGYVAESPAIHSSADLAGFINRLNHEGVTVYRRLSPPILITLMEIAAKSLAELHASRDPNAMAPFGVSWAGEENSANWFHTAREFTERWHHQQQIRLAVDKPGIMTRELYFPVLDCFLRALPFAYRGISAKPGTYAEIIISGECGGSWFLHRTGGAWQLVKNPPGEKVSEIMIPQQIAWRIFTKGIRREVALSQVKVSGDVELGLHVLDVVSIVA